MKRYLFIITILLGINSVNLVGQEFTIKSGSVFHSIIDTNSITLVNTVEFKQSYLLTGSDSYERFEDHFRFIPGDSNLLKDTSLVNISTDTVDISVTYDFRTANRYANNEIWYALDPDIKLHSKSSRVVQMQDSKWRFTTVVVSAKNRLPIGDTIPSTWEMKFSPGFAWTTPVVAWHKIKTPKKVTTSAIELGIISSLTTVDINEKTTNGKYKNSRKALTINVGALVNLSIERLDIGLFGGLDFPIGDGATKWIYFTRPNWGFIFGVDLIKPNT